MMPFFPPVGPPFPFGGQTPAMPQDPFSQQQQMQMGQLGQSPYEQYPPSMQDQQMNGMMPPWAQQMNPFEQQMNQYTMLQEMQMQQMIEMNRRRQMQQMEGFGQQLPGFGPAQQQQPPPMPFPGQSQQQSQPHPFSMSGMMGNAQSNYMSSAMNMFGGAARSFAPFRADDRFRRRRRRRRQGRGMFRNGM